MLPFQSHFPQIQEELFNVQEFTPKSSFDFHLTNSQMPSRRKTKIPERDEVNSPRTIGN